MASSRPAVQTAIFNIMIHKDKITFGILAVATATVISGCTVAVRPYRPAVVVTAPPPPPPAVIVQTPPPPPPAVVVVPDSYVWDGYEYVGVVGGQYYYLGPHNVWIVCDRVRLDRFHAYIRIHPDWRTHAVRNDRYRRNAH